MDRISTVIPVYNAEEYLARCVDSILGQTCPPCEIILVDDGSTDGSPALCDAYAREYPGQVRAVHQLNQGPSSARNAGIEASCGDYISFVDADDYLEPEAYAILLSLLRERDADAAAMEMLVEKPDGSVYRRFEGQQTFCWDTENALIELCSYRHLYVMFGTYLYARRLFEKHQFPPGRECEDQFLQYRVLAECRRLAYTPQGLYHYVQSPQSRSRTPKVSLAPLEATAEQLAFFQERFPQIAWAAETDFVFTHMSIAASYLRSGQKCPPALEERLRSACRGKLKSVLMNGRIPKIKKLQALAFCFCPPVYRRVIAGTEHR